MKDIVKVEFNDTIGKIILNRPAKLNAINQALAIGLLSALQNANANADCKIILLCGEGASFCAGDDLKELGQGVINFDLADETIAVIQDITREIMFNDKPVICAVQGWAIGAGFSWVLNADMSIWASDTKAFLPEAHYGMHATGAATFLLSHRIGNASAMEMMLLGNEYTASRLKDMGLAGEVVEAEKLMETAEKIAFELKKIPANMLRDIKYGALKSIKNEIEIALVYEAEKCREAMRNILGTNEIKEKTAKFQEGTS
ncbi:MAG: enoyl-CoA hydratase/isomerase family protein [Emcibacter sp.]|nr:enoyl-CoA hydratase/isomerase family protein [Emcibacter sp.]